jgi:hypothetical protein
MNQHRYFFFLLILLTVLTGLQSCLPERKVAEPFLQAQLSIDLQVTPPGLVWKYNHKGETIDGFDSLSPQQQDSVLWDKSLYIQFISDSILLENYMNAFISELRLNGFNVSLNINADSSASGNPQSYVIEIAQMQLDEYLYPLEDEDAFLDTIYYKKFNLNAIDYSCWFELRKAFAENAKTTLLYDSKTAYDTFDGRFFNDPLTGTVRYKYSIDSLKIKDVYDMATYLGKQHAEYLYDFFMNQYIAKHLPEGLKMENYFHYDRIRKTFTPANENRFDILGTK